MPARRRFAWALGACVVLGLTLRLVVIVTQQGPTDSDVLISGDGWDYHLIADSLADGDGFVSSFTRSESGRPPAWPLLLSVATRLNGDSSLFVHQILAAVVGAVTIGLVGLAARKIAGPRTGIIAAGITAIYPGMWIYEWPILSETLLLPVIALFLWAVYAFREHPSTGRAVTLGLLVGALVLIRSEQLLVALFVVTPLILRAPSTAPRRRVAWLGLAGLATVAVLTPWAVHTMGRFDDPVVLSTGLGNTMLAGNCDSTYAGVRLGHYDPKCNFGVVPDGTDPSVADSIRRERAIAYMGDHRGRIPVVVVAREGRVLGLLGPGDLATWWADWSKVPVWQVQAWIVLSWALTVVAVYGAVVLRRRRVVVYPLLGFVAITLLAVGATIGELRYRAGMEISVVILAAVGVDEVLRRWRSSVAERASAVGEDPTEELGADQSVDLRGI
jgi:hypothetical protein